MPDIKIKKVIVYSVVTSVDPACALHYESLGARMIYEKLEQQAVVVGICAHDIDLKIYLGTAANSCQSAG